MQTGTAIKTKIVVISMENSLERRRRFEQRAQNAAVSWDFFPAYTTLHPALTYDVADALVAKGRSLSPGELGCYSSHYAAWESLLQSSFDQYVILEDDVIPDWELLAKIVTFDLATINISFLRLCYNVPVKNSIVKRRFLNYNRRIVELFGYASGTQGYVIAKPAAKVLLDYCKRVRRPIDDQIDSSWKHGIRNLSVFPFSVVEESGDSAIGLERYETQKMPPKLRLRHALDKQKTRFAIRLMRISHRLQKLLGRAEL
jgi:glycosyl transferase family 25